MQPINMTIHNRSESDRPDEPVAVGVPFPRGLIKQLPEITAVTDTDKRKPVQAHPLAVWDDGSIKFALAQFPVDLPRNSSTRLRLEPGQAPRPAPVCRLEEQADSLVINTGPMQVFVNKAKTAGLDKVVVDGKEVFGSGISCNFFMVEIWELYGHVLGAIDKIEIEERGPYRVCVRLRGRMLPPTGAAGHYGFELVLMAYAGKRQVRAQYTFIALDAKDIYPVERLGLRVRFHENNGRITYRVDGDNNPHTGNFGKGDGCAFHAFRGVDGDKYYWSEHGKPIQTGAHLPGRVSFKTGSCLIGMAVREFEQNGPGGIRLGWDKSYIDAEVRFYDGAQKTLRLAGGRSRTHDVLWIFSGSTGNLEQIHNQLAAFQQPCVPAVDPVYFCQTGAFGDLRPAGKGLLAEYDRSIRKGFEAWQNEMNADPRNRGIMNYGDFVSIAAYGSQVGGFMNEEYDPAHGLYLLYARTGDPDYYEAAGRLSRHFMDVDINQLSGHQSFHGYPPRMERHEENIMNNSTDWGHIFNDCLVDYYLLTGDRRALRTAARIGEIACAAAGKDEADPFSPRYILKGCERTLGWPVIVMARTYEITQDPMYLQTIDRIANYLQYFTDDPWRELAEGGWWWRTLMQDGCKPFMVGLVMEGLCKYHEVTRDPAVVKLLDKIAGWVIANMWNDELGKFEYEFNAYNAGHRSFAADELMTMPLAYLYVQTKKPEYLHVLKKMVGPDAAKFTAVHGKEFGMVTHNTMQLLAIYEKVMNDQSEGRFHFRDYTRKRNKPLPPSRPLETVLHAPFNGSVTAEGQGRKMEPRLHGQPQWKEGPGGRRAVYFGLNGPRYDQAGGLNNLNVPDHAAYSIPADTLLAWGYAGIWARYEKDLKEMRGADPRPLIYIRGKSPKRDALLLCFIYNELRVRLYDSNGWLCGAAETVLADLESGTWHHYAAAWQPDGLELYVDGIRRAVDDKAVLPDGGQNEIFVGWCDGNWCACFEQSDLYLLRGGIGTGKIDILNFPRPR